ncbi:MAG: VPLPA-CTERM sorting domain-containing protein [Proteobacteria bacterium]|nr:VPLPA-CTERM sorting domain-containing protein [Pseudomonadota bacterium]
MLLGVWAKGAAFAAAVVFGSYAAEAATYSFVNITNNNATDAAAGQSQLTMDVLAVGTTGVSFTFLNVGAAAMSIADVYWDDQAGTLGAMGSITSSSGVSFSQGAAPPNLPGGQSVGFSATGSADSNPPVQPNGVNPGEWLTIVWSLISGATYSDVLAALNLGGDQAGSLRVGIHVQGFAGGGSEAFVNGTPPPAPVPVPAAGLLLIGALGGLAAMRGKKRKA